MCSYLWGTFLEIIDIIIEQSLHIIIRMHTNQTVCLFQMSVQRSEGYSFADDEIHLIIAMEYSEQRGWDGFTPGGCTYSKANLYRDTTHTQRDPSA